MRNVLTSPFTFHKVFVYGDSFEIVPNTVKRIQDQRKTIKI